MNVMAFQKEGVTTNQQITQLFWKSAAEQLRLRL